MFKWAYSGASSICLWRERFGFGKTQGKTRMSKQRVFRSSRRSNSGHIREWSAICMRCWLWASRWISGPVASLLSEPWLVTTTRANPFWEISSYENHFSRMKWKKKWKQFNDTFPPKWSKLNRFEKFVLEIISPWKYCQFIRILILIAKSFSCFNT